MAIKIENVEVFGWEAAIRGARNPMNSWRNGDSGWYTDFEGDVYYKVGKKDLKLMQSLADAGSDHGKFMRMINVTLDITAMQPWWSEFDTYKIATVRNSCSKMHKIHVKPFEYDDFEHEGIDEVCYAKSALEAIIQVCENLREDFNRTGEKVYWRALIELLPEGYRMRATVQLNYQVLKSMYHARKHHKLQEWIDFCEWVKTLPHSELITGALEHDSTQV